MMERKTLAALRREAEKRNDRLSGGAGWRAVDFALYFLMIVLVMLAVRAVLIDPVRVDGQSMENTLENGEVMIVDRAAYAFTSPKRGDIVLCFYPDEYYKENKLAYATRVKRVVAVAGDTILLENGVVYVNGEAVEEPYVADGHADYRTFLDFGVVPENCVFVLGDNRAVSRDSKYSSVGPIPLERVVGKVRLIIYPLSKLKLV